MPLLQASSGEEDSAFMRKKKVLKNNSKHEKSVGMELTAGSIFFRIQARKGGVSHLFGVTKPSQIGASG